ncbi:MAG TPA: hypothetical protein VIJ87_11215 [Pyrinomonadaceae bacterium]
MKRILLVVLLAIGLALPVTAAVVAVQPDTHHVTNVEEADAYLSLCFVVPVTAFVAYSDCHTVINNGGLNLQRVHLYCGDDIGGIVKEVRGPWVGRGSTSWASCAGTPGIYYRSYDLI